MKKISVLLLTGVEDGQTVRMPVGKREIFITFRVGALFAQSVWAFALVERVQPRLLMGEIGASRNVPGRLSF